MTTPPRNKRTLRIRELANELENAEWPDEEPTNPVIVQVYQQPAPTPPSVKTLTSPPQKAANWVSDWLAKGIAGAVEVLKLLPAWARVIGLISLLLFTAWLINHFYPETPRNPRQVPTPSGSSSSSASSSRYSSSTCASAIRMAPSSASLSSSSQTTST